MNDVLRIARLKIALQRAFLGRAILIFTPGEYGSAPGGFGPRGYGEVPGGYVDYPGGYASPRMVFVDKLQ